MSMEAMKPQRERSPNLIGALVPWLILAAALWALSGCASQTPAPSTPTTAQIVAKYAALETSGVPAPAYLTIGMTLENQACISWFSQQIMGAQQTSLGQGLLGLGAGGAALAGGPHAAAAAGGMGLLSALLGINQANSAAGADPVGTYILTNKMLAAYRAAVTNPSSIEDADALLESYAELCQLPGIQSAIRMALVTAPVTAMPAPQGFVGQTFGAPPQRILPPVVVVGPPPQGPPTLTPPSDDPPTPRYRYPHRVRPQVAVPAPDYYGEKLRREWEGIERAGGRAAYERASAER